MQSPIRNLLVLVTLRQVDSEQVDTCRKQCYVDCEGRLSARMWGFCGLRLSPTPSAAMLATCFPLLQCWLHAEARCAAATQSDFMSLFVSPRACTFLHSSLKLRACVTCNNCSKQTTALCGCVSVTRSLDCVRVCVCDTVCVSR